VDWVNAMDRDNVVEKGKAFMKAIYKHNLLMNEAREAKGCDRHLLGLYCIAMEAGLPIPQLFNDPSYTKR